jgi:hypothetical protein
VPHLTSTLFRVVKATESFSSGNPTNALFLNAPTLAVPSYGRADDENRSCNRLPGTIRPGYF